MDARQQLVTLCTFLEEPKQCTDLAWLQAAGDCGTIGDQCRARAIWVEEMCKNSKDLTSVLDAQCNETLHTGRHILHSACQGAAYSCLWPKLFHALPPHRAAAPIKLQSKMLCH